MFLTEMFEDDGKELTLVDALRDFLPLAAGCLNIEKFPRIKLVRKVNSEQVPTFGRFVSEPRMIYLDIENRHPVDVLRTLAHELTHFAQGEKGELESDSWKTGSEEENEANAQAGVVMRHFNIKYPQYLKLKPIVF